jgi:quinol monooxygenase YgiN
MIGIVATLRVQEGKGPEFEAIFRQLSEKVRADEPGNLVYQLTKSRLEPNAYKVLELYKDETALAAHRGSSHYRELGAKMGPCLAGRPEVEVLDAV